MSPDYLTEGDPFADFIVHEAADIFHNCKRRPISLHETRPKQWLLDIELTKRKTFAYPREAYARIVARAKSLAERRAFAIAQLRGARRPGGGDEHRRRGCERAERLEGDLRTCAATARPRSIAQLVRDLNANASANEPAIADGRDHAEK